MTGREAEIQARLDAATPGPWYWRNTQSVYLLGKGTRCVMAFSRLGMQEGQPEFRSADNLMTKVAKENINTFPDASLIANAPTDLAYLLARVATLEAQVAAVRELHAMDVGTTFDNDGREVDWPHCLADFEDWPCLTVAALDSAATS